MKSIKLLVSSAFVLALLAPVFVVGRVNAQSSIYCDFPNQQLDNNICDMSVLKEVSVDGGAFMDAGPSSSDAVQANIGDTVVWRITVENTSSNGGHPFGYFYVEDVLPNGVNYSSFVTSDGSNYDVSTNTWEIYSYEATTFPVTLTITTTADEVGPSENIATFVDFACDGPEYLCGYYLDGDSENNTDNAWIEVSAAPVVLADSTEVLANTGSGLVASLLAAGLILSTSGILAYNHISRRS